MEKIGNIITKSMTILDATDENRFFEGYLTVEMKDKQGEITIVDELYKVLPIWMDRGAPITDTHSNRVVGKGINFMKTTFEHDGVTYPAIKLTGKIHKNYELDTDIWEKIKSGEYRGLSFGGATKADRTPKVMKDGSVAYALKDLEHYEVAVCKDPAVPLALITEHNPLAKALVPSIPRGDGKEIIKCTNFGCYIEKGEDLSNADIVPATVSQTVDAGGMGKTVKPIKTDDKIGDTKKLDGETSLTPTKLDGGLVKNESPSTTGTGGGLRGLGEFGTSKLGNNDNNMITTTTEGVNNTVNSGKKEVKRSFSDAAINKVAGALLAGAGRAVASTVANAAKDIVDVGTGVVEGATNAVEDEVEKSAYQTEDGNNQLGGQGAPEEDCECNKKKSLYMLPIEKAEYQGQSVTLNSPQRDSGSNKKFKVFVRDPSSGNVVIVRFGDPNMEIKRDSPERRASFNARHKCSEQKDITSAAYWSCRMWQKGSTVSDNTNKAEEKMDNPCWEGYEAYGTKIKDGKEVPNCVPKKKKD